MAKTVSPTFMARPFCQGRSGLRGRTAGRAYEGQVDRAGGHPDDLAVAVGLAEHADGQAADSGEAIGGIVILRGKVGVNHVAIRHDQGRALVVAEDHARSDRLAAEDAHADVPLDEHVGPHGSLEWRRELLDRREIGGGSASRRSMVSPDWTTITSRTAQTTSTIPSRKPEAPARLSTGMRADAAHREQSQHDGDQTRDDPISRIPAMRSMNEAMASRLILGLPVAAGLDREDEARAPARLPAGPARSGSPASRNGIARSSSRS